MTVRGHAYERRGLLAIDPKAFLEVFFQDDSGGRENVEQGDAVIIDIRGPLEHREHFWCDSYPDIIKRVRAACETAARAVVLRFDSPGGDAAGCFEASDEIRAITDAAGKQLHALVEGDCCSAAYALASSSQSITITPSSLIGSIGVLSCRDDVSAMNAARGLRVALITSGARKADGHPDQPITDAELASTQALVDSMAGTFFELVARHRPTLTLDGVAKLQAKVFHGQQAVSVGLADEVGSLTTMLARVAGGTNGATNMAGSAYEKARALLQEAAEGDDANAAAAKRALAALDEGGGGGDGDGDKDKPADDKPADDKAEGDDSDKQAAAEPPAEDDKKAAAAAYRMALKAQQDNAALRAEIRKRDERDEREKLIASRPGMSPEMVAILQKAPIELVRETVAKQPANQSPELERAPTQGDGQSATASRLPASESEEMAVRMGLATAKPVNNDTPYRQSFAVAGRPVSSPRNGAALPAKQ